VSPAAALVPCLLALLPSAAVDALARSLIGGLDAEWSGAAAACVALDGLLPHAAGAPGFVTSVLLSLLDVVCRLSRSRMDDGHLLYGALTH
jgi:hypothetical protein